MQNDHITECPTCSKGVPYCNAYESMVKMAKEIGQLRERAASLERVIEETNKVFESFSQR